MDPCSLSSSFDRLSINNDTIFLSDDKKTQFVLSEEEAGFSGSQGVVFYKARRIRLQPDGTEKVKDVVALSLPKGAASESRVRMMQQFAVSELFPKNYGFFTTEYDHVVFQEKAEKDLLVHFDELGGLTSLSFEEKKKHIGSILRAACRLEESKVLHRDIKLDNFLVCSKGRIKLSDFGHACKIGDRERANDICGTLHTLAPEIIRYLYLKGEKPLQGVESDRWSLALVLRNFLSDEISQCESTLYDIGDLLEEGAFIKKSIRLLQEGRLTKEYSDELNKYLRDNEIRLSPTASVTIRTEKLLERSRIVDSKVINAFDKWQSEIATLPKRPEKITCLQELVTAMLQENPKDRISPKEALEMLNAITQ